MSDYKIKVYPQEEYRFQLYENTDRLAWQEIQRRTGCAALVNLWYFSLANYKNQAAVMLDGAWICPPAYDWPGICADRAGRVTTGGIGDAGYAYAACVQADYTGGRRTNETRWPKNGVTYTGLTGAGAVVCMLCGKDSGMTSEEAVRVMLDAGCVDILRWDGSWSSQGSLGPGLEVQPSVARIVRGYLLIYKKEGTDMEDPRRAIVAAAKGELGTAGGGKYVAWYNGAAGAHLALNVPWCAIFASWCARKAGVPAAQLPNYAGCTTALCTFRRLGTWRPRNGYVPQPGDLIFFDWDRDPGDAEHTGIVTGTAAGRVRTIEGNSGTPAKVREQSYPLSWAGILGYVSWDSQPEEGPVQRGQRLLNTRYRAALTVDGSWGPASKQAFIRAIQTEINQIWKRNLAVDGSFGPATKAACPNLRRGNQNSLVTLLQLGLCVKGWPLETDGSFGPGTETAVIRFQSETRQKSNGVAGGNTFAALVK